MAADRITLDPGYGFAKTSAQNLRLLAHQLHWPRSAIHCWWAGLASAPWARSPAGRWMGASRRAWRRRSRPFSTAHTSCVCTMSPPRSMPQSVASRQRQCRPQLDLSESCSMSRKFFGTDGIRGTVGQSPITPDFMLRLGHAVGRVLRRDREHPTVLIGKDTRISGYMIESALEAGFASAGVNVLLTGPLPTPGVAYLTGRCGKTLAWSSAPRTTPTRTTASFFLREGRKAARCLGAGCRAGAGRAAGLGRLRQSRRARRLEDARGRYIEFCKNCFGSDLTLRGLKIVVDAAHGAGYHVAPDVFHELGAEVIPMAASPMATTSTRASAPRRRPRWWRRSRSTVPTTAWRWTAMPTACNWWTRLAASTTATNCSGVMVHDRLGQGLAVPVPWAP